MRERQFKIHLFSHDAPYPFSDGRHELEHLVAVADDEETRRATAARLGIWPRPARHVLLSMAMEPANRCWVISAPPNGSASPRGFIPDRHPDLLR